jgi:hypothetical protein
MIFEGRNHRPVSTVIYRVVTVADIFFLQETIRCFPQTAPNCWYSFRYGDVLPSLIFALLVIYKIINGSSDYGGADRTPTPMPKSVQTNFLENIGNLKSSENVLVF